MKWSALTNNTARVGDNVVFTCNVTNGTRLTWLWNDVVLDMYTSSEHSETGVCGTRNPYEESSNSIPTQAEIYTTLAAVVPVDGQTANCYSLLEIKPTVNFSRVEILCVGHGLREHPITRVSFLQATIPPPGIYHHFAILSIYFIIVLAIGPSVISFSSSLEGGGSIMTNELAVFTCRVFGDRLQWIYDSPSLPSVSNQINEVAYELSEATICNANRINQNKTIEYVEFRSVNAESGFEQNVIASVLEVKHQREFNPVTIRCRAIKDQEKVDRSFVFNIKGNYAAFSTDL